MYVYIYIYIYVCTYIHTIHIYICIHVLRGGERDAGRRGCTSGTIRTTGGSITGNSFIYIYILANCNICKYILGEGDQAEEEAAQVAESDDVLRLLQQSAAIAGLGRLHI
jgi:hypothetical protein